MIKFLTFSLLTIFSLTTYAVNVQSLSFSHSNNYTMVEDTLSKYSMFPGNHRMSFFSNYTYVNDPLVETNSDRTARNATLVQSIQTLNFGTGYMFHDRLFLGISSSINKVHLNKNTKTALGDSVLTLKYRITGNEKTALAIIPEITLPTGDESLFIADKKLGAGIKFAIEHNFHSFQATANLGYQHAPGARFRDLDYRNRVTGALGIYVPLDNDWGVNAEASGFLPIPADEYHQPNEFYVGVKHQYSKRISFMGGMSLGNIDQVSSNDFRVLIGLKISGRHKRVPARRRLFPLRMTRNYLQINQSIAFEHDSTNLKQASSLFLDDIAENIMSGQKAFKKIIIEGHSNRIGDSDYNKYLSEMRAKEVKNYLVTKGVPADLLDSVGYGEERPLTEELEGNRRVEFKVKK